MRDYNILMKLNDFDFIQVVTGGDDFWKESEEEELIEEDNGL